MPFFEEYERAERAKALGAGGQNDTSGVCQFCGYAGDDILLGVCPDCALRLPSEDDELGPSYTDDTGYVS